MNSALLLSVFVLVLVFTPYTVRCEEGIEVMDEFDEYLDGGEAEFGAGASYAVGILPDHTNNKIIAGKPTSLLMAFTNLGSEVFNISSIGAYLAHPMNPTYIIQNYSRMSYSSVHVGPMEHVSVEYSFRPDSFLEDVDLLLVADVHYSTEDSQGYGVTFFNSTVHLDAAPFHFDAAVLVSYLLYSCAVALVGYIFATTVFSSPRKTFKAVKKSTTGTSQKQNSNDLDDYLPAGLRRNSKKND